MRDLRVGDTVQVISGVHQGQYGTYVREERGLRLAVVQTGDNTTILVNPSRLLRRNRREDES